MTRTSETESVEELVTTLECDHCGDVAIESPTGLFSDGDGGKCGECGFPGHVSCDTETPAYWMTSVDDAARCDMEGCDECNPEVTDGEL